jgi:hypothetical protein
MVSSGAATTPSPRITAVRKGRSPRASADDDLEPSDDMEDSHRGEEEPIGQVRV